MIEYVIVITLTLVGFYLLREHLILKGLSAFYDSMLEMIGEEE